MSRTIRRALLIGPALAVTYLVLLPSVQVGDLLVAILAAAVALWLSRTSDGERGIENGARARPSAADFHRLLRLFYRLIRGAVLGTWSVASIALGLRPVRGPGVVDVPIGDRTAREAALVGLVATLSPGSILLDVDPQQGKMTFHVIGQTEAQFRADLDALWYDLGPLLTRSR